MINTREYNGRLAQNILSYTNKVKSVQDGITWSWENLHKLTANLKK